ncbi:hypothetical protein ANCCEY_06168 [Ancylostoma ceylanicum]|uniref:Transcription factor CBF/NF-Y/archaeal histone domain-containing protein n=1 Tax=Ancylostoma ceylanicum TaxID=53326 RepID=A0A0D6LU69_9BILA|nr:hypothetical protein ANCCEY_06168 [Ancylostoma ceylanicum]
MSDLNPIHHDDNPGPSSSMGPPLFIPSSTGGPIRRRRFSTAKIQPTRIKKVMQSDEEIGRMVASVPVAIGRAMEHFAEKFLQAAAQATQLSNSRTLTPVHMLVFLQWFKPTLQVQFVVLVPLFLQWMRAAPPPMEYHSLRMQSTAVTMAAAIPSPPVVPATSTRKAPNGKKSEPYPEGEKPKRGRPRKIKRSEKCLDEELCEEVTNGIEKEDQDRALMPPPALPLGRAKPVA